MPIETTSMNLALISTGTFLLGLILGHRLAIHKDKRQEFNALTDKPYAALCEQIRCADRMRCSPEAIIDVDRTEVYLPAIRRGHFCRCVKRYEKAYRSQPGPASKMYALRPEDEVKWKELASAAKCLRGHLKRR